MRPDELTEHPEGGRFREVHRSALVVTTADGRERPALTHIYFALARGERSLLHRVASDEVWNLYRGDGVVLHLWDGEGESRRIELSEPAGAWCHVVPAGWWQATSRPSSSLARGGTDASHSALRRGRRSSVISCVLRELRSRSARPGTGPARRAGGPG